MNQNSWITPGKITACKYKREFYKELQSNNPTVASYYRDTVYGYKKAKKIYHDKLIL